ncbi:DUF4421 family protein [Cytophaga aurantiaca]|uniref:DUF4421 family protein n=1 Tax=Cytophaga aurantiaca TaxID=29530 RepID=UPI0003747E47|nr:DUF4421 family protein [Cytophaga aurantiaca]
MRVVLFFSSFIFFITLVHAQEQVEYSARKVKLRADTNFVKSYKNYLTVGLFIAAPINFLTITPKDSAIKKSTYKTNLASIIGFTVAYKSIYAAIGFRAPVEADKSSTYGKTYFKAFAIGTQKTRFSIRFDYRKTNGFYNSDSLIYNSSTNSSSYLKRGDVNTKQYMLSGLYNFSWKKYSYLSSFNFSEHQLKTRFGFILKSSFSSNQLKSDSSLINLTNTSSVSDGIQQLNYTSFVIGPGMGLNVVIAKRIYFSMMLFLSYDFVGYKFIDNNNNVIYKSSSITAFFEEKMAVGYHSKRFYAGLKFTADQIQVQTRDYKVGNLFGALTLDVGYRFNAPGILKKVYAKTFTKYLGM